jgi:hypothetical protein
MEQFNTGLRRVLAAPKAIPIKPKRKRRSAQT